jgi:hypothetical protein
LAVAKVITTEVAAVPAVTSPAVSVDPVAMVGVPVPVGAGAVPDENRLAPVRVVNTPVLGVTLPMAPGAAKRAVKPAPVTAPEADRVVAATGPLIAPVPLIVVK